MPREVGPDERLKELAKEVRALGEGHGHIHWQWADEIDKQVDRWREADAAWESEHGEHALPPAVSDAQAPSGEATEPPEEAQARRLGDARGGNVGY